MEEAAADAIALADELGWDRFSLIGHSMGGKAVQVLLQAPDRVPADRPQPGPATAVPMDEQGWELFSGAPGNAGNRAAIIDLTTGGKLTATFVNYVVRHSLENSAVEAFAAYLQSWAKTDFSDQVKRTPAAGQGHRGGARPGPVRRGDGADLAGLLPRGRDEILPNAGHYPMFETPAALAASIEEFLGPDSAGVTGAATRPGPTPRSSSTRPPTSAGCP